MFNTVSLYCLLLKLQSYRIKNRSHAWNTSWLTQWMQRIIVASRQLPVKSGVPQGAAVGPLMFLIYINDIGEDLSYCLRLFADNSLLYQIISSEEDCTKLQHDLDSIYKLSNTWQMRFKLSKCVTLKCYKSLSPILTILSMTINYIGRQT